MVWIDPHKNLIHGITVSIAIEIFGIDKIYAFGRLSEYKYFEKSSSEDFITLLLNVPWSKYSTERH